MESRERTAGRPALDDKQRRSKRRSPRRGRLAGDEILATAILDRLLHHSHVLNIKDRSYRPRDLERAEERTE